MWLEDTPDLGRPFAFLEAEVPAFRSSSGASSSVSELGHAGPGYCANGWDARVHGAEGHLAGTISGVDLNACLSHCWKTEGCWCTTYEHDRKGKHHLEDEWEGTGTCWLHTKCDKTKVDKNVHDVETCIITS
jgi:hypothetical protein